MSVARVASAREIEQPPRPDDWADEREFPSPDGGKRLWVGDPWEFAMDGWHWQALLRTARGQVLAEWTDVGSPTHFRPWSFDGERLALKRIARDINRLDVLTGAGAPIREVDWRGHYLALLGWAPTIDRLLAVGGSRVVLLDSTGRTVAERRVSASDRALAGWLGNEFFVLGGGGELTFFSGEDGSVQSREVVDPLELLPYDAETYAALRRDSWVLRTGRGTKCVGALLDDWSTRYYDEKEQRLLLAVLRPTGPMSRGTAPAAPRWVEVRLAA